MLADRGLRLTLASIALVQLAPLLNKFALEHMNPMQAATLNTALVFVFASAYRLRPGRRRLEVRRRGMLLLLGLTDALGVLFLYLSIALISPVMFSLLGRFYTVFAVLLGALWLKERLNPREAVLVGVAVIATFLFSVQGVEATSVLGTVFALAYTFAFALSNLLAKLAVGDTDAVAVLWYNKALGLAFIVVFGMASGKLLATPIEPAGLWFVALAALVSNGLGLVLFYQSLRFIDFQRANVIRSIGPVLAALYAWPWFPVRLSALNWAGGVVLLVAVGMLSLSRGGAGAGRRPALPGRERHPPGGGGAPDPG